MFLCYILYMVTFRKFGKLGRFGNQLFQYAGTRLYAEKFGFRHALPQWIGCEVFENISHYSTLEYLYSRFLPTRKLADIKSYNKWDKIKYLTRLTKKLPETISIERLYQKPQDNVSLYGYMQDEFSFRLLRENKEKVLGWFKFKKKTESAFHQATNQYRPWVGIHIRKGDFVKRGLDMPIEPYIEFLNSKKEQNIYISSDDSKIKEAFGEFTLIKPTNPLPQVPNFIFDFWMLKESETILGCGSTFSWWAAYLGNKNSYYSPPLTHLWQENQERKLERQEI